MLEYTSVMEPQVNAAINVPTTVTPVLLPFMNNRFAALDDGNQQLFPVEAYAIFPFSVFYTWMSNLFGRYRQGIEGLGAQVSESQKKLFLYVLLLALMGAGVYLFYRNKERK